MPRHSPSHVFPFLFFLFLSRAGTDDAIVALKPEQANKRDLCGVGSEAKFLQPVRLGQPWPLYCSLTEHSCSTACLLCCLSSLAAKPFLPGEMQKPPVPQFLLLSNSVIASSWGCYIRGEWSGEARGRNMLLAFILHFLVLNLLLEKLGCFHPS